MIIIESFYKKYNAKHVCFSVLLFQFYHWIFMNFAEFTVPMHFSMAGIRRRACFPFDTAEFI